MDDKEHNLVGHTKRIEYIDIFRAFGIILMIMGHVGFGEGFDHYIHAFHMPMFFFISGFLYKEKGISFRSYLAKKVKHLLIPYLIFGIVLYSINIFIQGSFDLNILRSFLLFPTQAPSIAGALWFLPSLFLADILYYGINRIKNSGIACVLVILAALIGQFFPMLFGIELPFALSGAFVGVGLMHIGRVLRKYESKLVILKSYFVVIGCLVVSFSIMRADYVNMRAGVYPKDFLIFWVNSVAASILLLNIAKWIDSLRRIRLVNRYLNYLGRNSIVYLCLNQALIMLCFGALYFAIEHLPVASVPMIFLRIASLCGTLVILFFLSLLFDKTKLKVMMGRF